jgi:hypothetical protein
MTMTLIQALGPSVETVAILFGVLAVSLSAAVIALLDDY